MVNYNKSTIYKLCCNDLNVTEIYIGSTTNSNKRKNAHKTVCNNKGNRSYNLYVYQFIRSNGGFQNWSMVEIELFNARDKKDLYRRERHWIETERAVLNSYRAYVTEEEKIEEIKENLAEYRANNKEKINAKAVEYYANNKEEKKAKAVEYYANNKEEKKAKTVEYYANNKDTINAKVTCNCGSIISRHGLIRHNKTKKHQTFLQH
jgi:hypothetical protein